MYELGKVEDEDVKLVVGCEHDPISPREWDNMGTMVCSHKRYSLGDEEFDVAPEQWYEENVTDDHVVLPLYLYDHSGITINTTGFTSGWDSGMIGWIYAEDREDINVKKVLEAEVEEYDKYLRGEVYAYEIFDKETCDKCGNSEYNSRTSCGGFYSEDCLKDMLLSELPEKEEFINKLISQI